MSDCQRPHGLQPTKLLHPWDFPGKNTGVGSHSLLQGIFLTHGSNLDVLHCRQILYHMSHQGRPLNNLPFISPISAQLFSCVQLYVTPWMVARQASLSITNSQSLLKLMSIELVMPSNHLILCHPLQIELT